MNEKEFDRLQSAVQWVIDTHRAMRVGEKVPLVHQQRVWGVGVVQEETLPDPVGIAGGLTGMRSETHPVCGTGCCLAGYVVLAHGDTFAVKTGTVMDPVAEVGDTVGVTWCIDSEGEAHVIGARARELLGISEGQSRVLFDGLNEPWMIRDHAIEIAAGYGHRLEIL
jgi:hypothetical protein